MAMKARAIRAAPPLPGKTAIDLEFPNGARAVLSLRELLERRVRQTRASPLALALGDGYRGGSDGDGF